MRHSFSRCAIGYDIPKYLSKSLSKCCLNKFVWSAGPSRLFSTTRLPTADGKLRRFYNAVTVQPMDGCVKGGCVMLDGRPMKTPGGNNFILPNEKTALLIAQEWELQSDYIKFELMPLTNLAIQTLDLISLGDTRLQVEAQALKYLKTDAALFRVTEQEALASKQAKILDPILRNIEKRYALEKQLSISDSLMFPQQHQPDLDILASILKKKNAWELGCLFTAVRNLKSYLLGVSLLDGAISVEEACEAANVEEYHQRKRWGEVEGNHDVENSVVEMWLNAAILLQHSVKEV